MAKEPASLLAFGVWRQHLRRRREEHKRTQTNKIYLHAHDTNDFSFHLFCQLGFLLLLLLLLLLSALIIFFFFVALKMTVNEGKEDELKYEEKL